MTVTSTCTDDKEIFYKTVPFSREKQYSGGKLCPWHLDILLCITVPGPQSVCCGRYCMCRIFMVLFANTNTECKRSLNTPYVLLCLIHRRARLAYEITLCLLVFSIRSPMWKTRQVYAADFGRRKPWVKIIIIIIVIVMVIAMCHARPY